MVERFVRVFRPGRSRGPRGARSPRTSTARRCRTGTSRASASRARASVRVFNPTIEEHGWQSTHTVIEIVNDDMPFLVDSVTMEVNRHGLTLHLIIHPIMRRRRATADGTLTGLAADGAKAATRESFIHVEVDRVSDAAALRGAGRRPDARAARRARRRRRTGRRCMAQAREIVAEIEREPPPLPADEARRRARRSCAGSPTTTSRSSAIAVTTSSRSTARTRCRSCRARAWASCARSRDQGRRGELRRAAAGGARLRAPARAAGRHQVELALDRASSGLSRLHRHQALRRAGRGRAASIASSACSLRPPTAPNRPRFRCCGARSANVIARARPAARRPRRQGARSTSSRPIRATSCSRSARTSCCDTAMGILHLGERQRFRLFVRRDPFERFVSCLIYAPRENYTTELRQKWQAILHARRSTARAPSSTCTSRSRCWRASMITVRTTPGAIPGLRRARARSAARRRRAPLGATISSRR